MDLLALPTIYCPTYVNDFYVHQSRSIQHTLFLFLEIIFLAMLATQRIPPRIVVAPPPPPPPSINPVRQPSPTVDMKMSPLFPPPQHSRGPSCDFLPPSTHRQLSLPSPQMSPPSPMVLSPSGSPSRHMPSMQELIVQDQFSQRLAKAVELNIITDKQMQALLTLL